MLMYYSLLICSITFLKFFWILRDKYFGNML